MGKIASRHLMHEICDHNQGHTTLAQKWTSAVDVQNVLLRTSE